MPTTLTLIAISDDRIQKQMEMLGFIKKNVKNLKQLDVKIKIIPVKSGDLKRLKNVLNKKGITDLPALVTKDHIYYEYAKDEITNYIKMLLDNTKPPSIEPAPKTQKPKKTKTLSDMSGREYIEMIAMSRDNDDEDMNDEDITRDKKFKERQQYIEANRTPRQPSQPRQSRPPPPPDYDHENDQPVEHEHRGGREPDTSAHDRMMDNADDMDDKLILAKMDF